MPQDTAATAIKQPADHPLLDQIMQAISDTRFGDALELLETRDAQAGVDPHSLHAKSLIHYKTHKIDAALRKIEQALKGAPHDPEFLHTYATFISSTGRFTEATRILVKLLAADPTYTQAFNTLAGIRHFKPGDDVLWLMEQNVVGRPLSPNKAANLCFGLAKAYDDLGEYDKAWQAVTQGNALVSMEDPTAYFDAGVARCKAVFTKDFIAQRRQRGHRTQAPVFVVGMPRSGTTLTEKILSEHADISATGELSALSQIGAMMGDHTGVTQSAGHADAMARAVPPQLYAAARGYLDYARDQIDGWSERFVDKMPDNSFNLGLAACLFPRAHMVHVMRHPLDVMLSIYFRKFGQITYAFTPAQIVAHYKSYMEIMAHWRRVLPQGQLIEVRYEAMVDNKDRARDRLLDRIIPATDHQRVLSDMHAAEAATVMTASRWQVRQPVYQTSKEKWRNYAAEMQVFIDLMGGMEAVETEIATQKTHCALRPVTG